LYMYLLSTMCHDRWRDAQKKKAKEGARFWVRGFKKYKI
jgi:hypothetical protein